jgi:peptide/nickel transport system substrate-binding protein
MTEPRPLADGRCRLSRRSFLQRAVLLGAATLLAACSPGAPAQPTTTPPPPAEASKPTAPPAQSSPGTAASPAGVASPGASPGASPAPGASPSPAAIASAPNRPPGSPKTGGTLVMAKTVEAAELDPQLTSSLARQRITMLTYNNLVKLSNEVAIQPDLAESWKVSPDGKQIDFALRKGVLWHPPVSRELVADDVKYSYDRLLRESPGKADFAGIDGVEVLDTYDVRFVLSAPNAGLLSTIADSRWGAIVNRETVEKHGDLRTVAVGTGPFILEERKPDQETRFRRNPDYFEKGKPYVESLVLRVIPNEDSIVEGLRAGTIDHAMLEDNRRVEAMKGQPGLQILRMPRLGYDFFNFNQAVAPFNKPEVVQAINYAVDREECIRAGAFGYAALTAPCTPPMKQWQLPEAQWKPYYKVDLEKAKALLAKAGLPNGFEATVLTIPAIPSMFANAQVVQANLKRIGINLRVESVDYNAWIQRWQKKDFEATLNTSSGYADPDTAFYRAFHSKAQNWNNIANPELDRLLDEGRAVIEIEKRKPIYDKVQVQLLERPGHLFLFSAEMIDVAQKRVQGLSQHPTTTLWSYQNVWLDD